MKFIEAVRAMGPGQLLVDPYKAQLVIKDGLITNWGNVLSELGHIDEDGWQVIDKPRPLVKFADAMRAALEGKVIKSSVSGYSYCFKNGVMVYSDIGEPVAIGEKINKGEWEIIEAEDGK